MTSTSSLGASSSLSASHAASFFTSFRAQASALSQRIESTSDPSSDATQILVQDLADLRRQLLDETDRIPPRDREGHERLLRDLSDKLATRSRLPAVTSPSKVPGQDAAGSSSAATQQSSKPAARFAFKRAAPKASVSSSSNSASTPQLPMPKPAQSAPDPHSTTNVQEQSKSSSDVHLRDEADALLDLRKKVTSEALLTIQIRGLKNCIVFLPPLQGSIMVHDCLNCIIISEQCQQYRMHTTTDSLVVLRDCPTGATIEGCDRILFSSTTESKDSPDKTDVFPVQDFDHVSSLTQSPHWRCLDPQPDSSSSTVDSIRQALSSLLSASAAPSHIGASRHELLTLVQSRIREAFS
ncbi:hypothetical protein OC845_002994 [Tilletia horrida]|nr:hypothetical protein OC845_002994 [Tilletia horrida]